MGGPASASPDEPLLELAAVMRRLRVECAWKAAQTHRSLARHLLEETHEALEAIDGLDGPDGDPSHLCEELGDLLLQVVFHAAVAEQAGTFTLADVARGITEKLYRRNPHVFGPGADDPAGPGADAPPDAAAVDEVWQQVKDGEKQRTSVLDGLPPTLPALLLADKALARLARRAPADGRVAGVGAGPGAAGADAEHEVGDRLLALVAEARAVDVDPEQALREAVRRAVAARERPGA